MDAETKPTYAELLKAAQEYREACCAAMRVIAEIDTGTLLNGAVPGVRRETAIERFIDEVHAAGIPDGFGARNDALLKRSTERHITIEKQWDGNEGKREATNGRVYVSRGRWQWVVMVDGEADRAFDLRREARAYADRTYPAEGK